MIQSAGILMYKLENKIPYVFLCKPFIHKNSKKCWGIPKGKVNENELLIEAAKREFSEETGLVFPNTPLFHLGSITYPSNLKKLHCWIINYDVPINNLLKSNLFEHKINNKKLLVPEIIDWKWFRIDEINDYIFKSQEKLIEKFILYLNFSTKQNILSYGEESFKESIEHK